MALIYKITNDINDKIYIGKTNFSIEKRFKEHCRDAQKGKRKTAAGYIWRYLDEKGDIIEPVPLEQMN